MEIGKDKLEEMLRTILTIRNFETRAEQLFAQGHIPGFVHLYIGEEAVATGVCANLRPTDYITSTHRGHGHCIGKGGDLGKMMAELYGKKGGYCKGKGGSMHIADMDLGILGANGIVGGGFPIAVGAGTSIQYRETDQVAVCFFGDGASNQSTFHESINLAAVWNLPVIFVCENNLYGISLTPDKHFRIQDISVRAMGYGIPGITIDGNDVIAVYEAASEAIKRAREGSGPTLIEYKTYRMKGHFEGDHRLYQPKEEVEAWQEKDPVDRYIDTLLSEGVLTSEEIERIRQETELRIDEAVRFAEESPFPEPAETMDDVFCEEGR